MNDIIVNKIQNIQRCIGRAREEYQAEPETFSTNYTRQDAALLNVLRACETSIDLANHVIRSDKLGIPVSSADSFNLLQAKGVIDAGLSERMKKMTAFRNTLVHQYTRMEMAIIEYVITSGLDDLLTFAGRIKDYTGDAAS